MGSVDDKVAFAAIRGRVHPLFVGLRAWGRGGLADERS